MSYDLREHTADVAVEATAPTLGGVFAAVADGMAAAMCEAVPDAGERAEIAVTAESREALLFDYLDELIYERDVREVLPVDNAATVTPPAAESPTASEATADDTEAVADDTGARADDSSETEADDHGTATDADGDWHVTASYRGVPLAAVRARDLKAVTYAEMDLSRRDGGWHAYVVFDV